MADPISAGSCTFWYDANDASTIHATGGLVDTWDDKSGNARNVTATTTARPTTGSRTFPVCGLNALDFDGTTDQMAGTSSGGANPWTIGVVLLCDNGANSTREQFVNAVTIGYGLEKAANNKWQTNAGSLLSSAADANTSAHILIGASGASGILRVDNAADVTGNAGAGAMSGGVSIGGHAGTNFFNGLMAEIVGYTGVLSGANRTALYDYFIAKWFTAPVTDFVYPYTTILRRGLRGS